ncbi:hypothetical protein TKK_0018169 [Trichogramma kaykai]
MSLGDETNFVVIEWVKFFFRDGKKAVELVPASWISCKDDQWFCQYPDEDDYEHVEDWVLRSKKPKKKWSSSKVKIIKEAKTHASGLRRLEKSFQHISFISSEDDSPSDIGQSSSILTKLNSVSSIEDEECISNEFMTKSYAAAMEQRVTEKLSKQMNKIKNSLAYNIKNCF